MGNEARKRKILENSSDRLALISGRLDSLGTPSPPSTPASPRGKRPNNNEFVKEAESSTLDTRTVSTYKPSSSSSSSTSTSTSNPSTSNSSCFSAKNINYCILSSEETRVFCSVMIALLVVIVKSESLIAARPLCVLLLSDVTIVLLRIAYATRHREFGGKDMKRAMYSREGDDNNWEVAIFVLEWGLVFYQCVRAAFIDFSFYLVIVTCGFSFM